MMTPVKRASLGRYICHELFSGNLPDAIQNDCKKCTQAQRVGADQVMHYIIDHRSADWEKLEEK